MRGITMNMKEAVSSVLVKKYATIEGRASRSEYWWFRLFSFSVHLALSNLDNALGWKFGYPVIPSGVLNLIFSLAILVPTVCVTARRLHDRGHSGWWMLFTFVIVLVAPMMVAILAFIPMIYWLVMAPKEGEEGRENKWGTNPLLDED